MNTLHKFPHIEQLRNLHEVLKHMFQNPIQTSDGWKFDESLPLPKLEFEGTTKVHGTNTAIIFDVDELHLATNIYCQSRETILTEKEDLNGFCKFIKKFSAKDVAFLVPFDLLKKAQERNVPVKIYGEWCGQGIQSGVAINNLSKRFIIFAIQIGDEWGSSFDIKNSSNPSLNIYSIEDFAKWKIVIDFNDINQSIIDKLSSLTEAVENRCPVAWSFGVDGVGEGIVWRCDIYQYNNSMNNSPLMFKTKGAKHKNIKESKVVQMEPEKLNSLNELVESVLTENRLNQGLEKIPELNKKYTPNFIKWIIEDVERENADMLLASGLDSIAIKNALQKASREWFLAKFSQSK